MKRVIALLLSCTLIITGCSNENVTLEDLHTVVSEITEITSDQSNVASNAQNVEKLGFVTLNDPDLLRYVEDSVYSSVVSELNSDEYFVENVSSIYLSKEYIEELNYNSQSNIFFGFTLSELEEQFQGKKYVFDLGDNGQTVVHEFEEYDDTYDRVIRNVAIGTGVILLCVTVSVVSGGVGATAVSMIFAASAKTGTVMALSLGSIGVVCAGIVKGIETGDFDQALKAAALVGSEAFKWGAITGSISGGVGEAVSLHGATINGLTMNEAAKIQKESGYPLDVIKQIKSMEEYNIYREAGLKPQMVNGKSALVRDIDLNYRADETELTNLELMLKGNAPLDPATGKAYQLHHINQSADGTLAILKESEHQGNSIILNNAGKESEIDRLAFAKVREAFWKAFGEACSNVG